MDEENEDQKQDNDPCAEVDTKLRQMGTKAKPSGVWGRWRLCCLAAM
jgi:hypothetical protein